MKSLIYLSSLCAVALAIPLGTSSAANEVGRNIVVRGQQSSNIVAGDHASSFRKRDDGDDLSTWYLLTDDGSYHKVDEKKKRDTIEKRDDGDDLSTWYLLTDDGSYHKVDEKRKRDVIEKVKRDEGDDLSTWYLLTDDGSYHKVDEKKKRDAIEQRDDGDDLST
ncbi:hypothetical protein E2P81_ATG00885 [Venturia nashicola]|nr:hypothetical protein E2P81_ATG00885 [Venturia nashicola]